MPLILQQRFPLGRFHATRWKQNPFEDRHGEWPPSPWRLLRALAARWIQFSRETGDDDTAARDDLLRHLAGELPEFAVPEMTWRIDPAIRQYHKIGVEWTAKGRKDPAYKKSMTTLAPDPCRAVPPIESVFWSWANLALPSHLQQLLDELLSRILYFGRAESFCLFRRIDELPNGIGVNCRLNATATHQSPVLVPKPGQPLNVSSLLAASDDQVVISHPIPPGAVWHYTALPKRPDMQRNSILESRFPSTLQIIQFAVGGRVYPHVREWIRVTERFRGAALKELARLLSGERDAQFALLPPDLRDEFALFSGKTGTGTPVSGHTHSYFALCPDEFGQPTRLVCFRRDPFRAEEVAALMAASEWPCSWRFERQRNAHDRRDEWQLRFVPLPFDTPLPRGLRFDGSLATKWISATPFVIPGGRRRFRKHGRLRPGETAERMLIKLLTANGIPIPEIIRLTDETEADWVAVHETHEQRRFRREDRTRPILPGHRFRLTFPDPVSGPICVGHSCHFGLGLFLPES